MSRTPLPPLHPGKCTFGDHSKYTLGVIYSEKAVKLLFWIIIIIIVKPTYP